MKMSVLIFNIIFIIIAALFIFPSLKRVIKYKSSSISDYVILLIAIFNVVPVLCDVIIGVPTYVYWYRSFDPVMTDFDTCLIYNTYIIITIMILQYYAYKRTKKNKKSNVVDTVRLSVFRHPAFDVALILLPLIFVVAKYGIRVFYGYSMLGTRNIQSGDSQLINQMITLSVYIYSTRYFSRLRKTREFILMLVFFFALIWLNGKRYMIVSIGEVIFYLYQMTNRKTTRRVKLGLIYSAVYKIPYMLNLCFAPIGQALFPHISQKYTKSPAEATVLVRKVMLFVAGSFGVICASIMILRNWLVPILFGSEYVSYSNLILILAPQLILGIINNFLGVQTLVAAGFKDKYSHCVIANIMVLLGSNLLLCPRLNAYGTAFSALIAEAVLCVLLIIHCKKYVWQNRSLA
ncbi:MAG: hypothetical protein IKG47_09155 [Oscillospiraceae bacterium]|nr:hypothetical protein [Oscillospiraceae bacterium]